jgi:hypothetical protein
MHSFINPTTERFKVDKRLSNQEEMGFKYIRVFYVAVKNYATEKHKKHRYRNFQEFYPKLFESLARNKQL